MSSDVRRPDASHQVNWNELRQKLDGVGASLSETMQASPAQAARILADRAARLREMPKALAARRAVLEVLSFVRGGERYALDLATLHSVQPYTAPARIPGAPAFIWGMVNVRGDIIAVADLATYLDAGADSASRTQRAAPEHLVVAVLAVQAHASDRAEAHDAAFVALPADSITGIVPADASLLAPPIHTFSDRKKRLLKGILPDGTLLLELGESFANAAREEQG